ncbi:MAG: 1-deoxy-D-xylulose-5-phosphate reductoisomerase [Candidatus Sedimenticola endophacoides]|uniref:1-deoxy-D-xylulose 5-phosphate reductoisomerase n=2 Tax=Candidatus Sedimenticola endophacoides TaxID=2548426 RepID=A0A6N4DNZ2_9GAMM|nr:MAG: 1-deoxy-D-xylulose-5-phosphate reductoisomerase [Candidatus Sedimenticola endophacoides]OQX36161.1 MAG: 1-deoxy-D-xylulose-5-phosphate reductoisomerase [Candidatus Sedimenticola endophacoides]OQX39936.1 MAG: 1-deoxy-D-xylulose-5-phosphate reductoisomerase [Candidatus Sedimenticola endophacoides]PUD98909.1 MAG: 1-deoxy-D-xylulose-5-phosphate reductoisomerase [Candidatus Sedimenticola endophacoides]PUD99621.1 MAG: 1-deoxy-D-xylulose-5-phosphate reductoisomerase [Candidatus Sedimenticola e
MIGLTVLGSTGSIGVSTLDVAARHPRRFRVVALTANRDVGKLFAQCRQFQPRYAVMADAECARELARRLAQVACPTEVLSGVEGLESVAALAEVQFVMAAIVGAAGLLPTLAAVRAGKRILLANKEALVVAGQLFMQEADRNNALILPIDSEHNAIFQCMPHDYRRGFARVGVERILLTASGGPFRQLPLERLSRVTPEQACAHPNWSMGRKISVDSATMMNKGLELIEACWLFHTTPERVQVVVHPQSVIHSMVQYVDGSVLAQLGHPDMRTPIAHAMAWPERITSGVSGLDLFEVARLDFEPPDPRRFPCLSLASQAITAGGTAPALLNAANEVAVAAFLEEHIGFDAIPALIEAVLNDLTPVAADSLETLLEADREARALAEQKARKLV